MNDNTRDPSVDEGRPRILKYAGGSKFRVGDKVLLDEPNSRVLEGPYLIASVPRQQEYTLCEENGQSWANGRIVEQEKLKLAK